MANGTFGGGNGSTTTPYLVQDAADLGAVRNGVSLHYKQTANINMIAVENFVPIATSAAAFTGSYDGQNFEIQNLTINKTTTHTGLFGSVKTPGVVRNVHVSNGNVTSTTNYTGGVFGEWQTTSQMQNISFSGSVTGTTYAGGVVGESGICDIKNCDFTGNVSGVQHVGGISGYSSGVFSNCHTVGSVTGTVGIVGGISGYKTRIGDYTDCTHSGGNISTNSGDVGGIIGLASTSYSITLLRCSSSAELIVGSRAAGIVVCDSTSRVTATECHFYGGTVRGTSTLGAVGIVFGTAIRCSNRGSVISMGSTFGICNYNATDCFNSGPLVQSTSTGNFHASGIAGYNVLRCYCSANVEGIGTNVGGVHSNLSGYAKNSYFLGAHIKGSGVNTSNIGRISSYPIVGHTDNYALDTSIIILE